MFKSITLPAPKLTGDAFTIIAEDDYLLVNCVWIVHANTKARFVAEELVIEAVKIRFWTKVEMPQVDSET